MTAEMPLVSVVIPTYNRPDYLRLALESVIRQSYTRLEIIVHDNASPVDLAPVVASFADPRIVLHRNERNLGIMANATLACRRATGKYVAILGDDDLWHPDFIANLVAPLEADEEVVVAFCDHHVIDGGGHVDMAMTAELARRFGRHRLREGAYRPFDDIALLYRSICIMSGAVLRRAAIDWLDLPTGISMGFDLYVAYLAARTGKACHYCPRRLMQYRYHRRSASSGLGDVEVKLGNARDAMVYWNRFLRDGGMERIRPYFEMKRGLNALMIVTTLARRGDWRDAWRELRGFLRAGLLPPRIFAYQLVYMLRMHRVTA